jgi:hypothetical protein
MKGTPRFAAAVGLTLAYGLFLLIGFDTGVQQDSAAALVAGADEARKFLVVDLAFPLFYAILVPLTALAAMRDEYGRRPAWVVGAAAALGLAGLFDWIENILLLAALEKESPNRVDAAHAVAVPKLVFFVIGAAGILVLLVRLLRRRESAD